MHQPAPPQRSERLQSLHHFIVERYPRAQLSLKYKMPTYEVDKGWVAIANQKNYVSLYTCAREHIQPYIDSHPKVKCGTGCLNFRDGDEIAWADLEPVLASAFSKGH
ncbi:DUF1801 domain-containing protein [Microbulbifer taiwanensis]|uniref:DUF1801 domain-containing protein n=1 Tax=Microbulbifer taiwanensis TaxID=986746 RepID=UPI00360C599C